MTQVVCCACLETSTSSINYYVLDSDPNSSNRLNLKEKLLFCVPEYKEVLENNEGFSWICNICCQALGWSYGFRKMCLKVKHKLEMESWRKRNRTREKGEQEEVGQIDNDEQDNPQERIGVINKSNKCSSLETAEGKSGNDLQLVRVKEEPAEIEEEEEKTGYQNELTAEMTLFQSHFLKTEEIILKDEMTDDTVAEINWIEVEKNVGEASCKAVEKRPTGKVKRRRRGTVTNLSHHKRTQRPLKRQAIRNEEIYLPMHTEPTPNIELEKAENASNQMVFIKSDNMLFENAAETEEVDTHPHNKTNDVSGLLDIIIDKVTITIPKWTDLPRKAQCQYCSLYFKPTRNPVFHLDNYHIANNGTVDTTITKVYCGAMAKLKATETVSTYIECPTCNTTFNVDYYNKAHKRICGKTMQKS